MIDDGEADRMSALPWGWRGLNGPPPLPFPPVAAQRGNF